jgi:hypothetical protein
VRVAWGANGWPVIDTEVRDRNGNLLVAVKNNHWQVYPQFCSDKNHTKDSLEVKDNSGHVVLQIRILADLIQLQGEWWSTESAGVRLMKAPDKANGEIFRLAPNMQHTDSLISPMFEYPSAEHLGQLAK